MVYIEERLATLPTQREAVKPDQLQCLTRCSTCGRVGNRAWRADDAVWFHDERYDRRSNPIRPAGAVINYSISGSSKTGGLT